MLDLKVTVETANRPHMRPLHCKKTKILKKNHYNKMVSRNMFRYLHKFHIYNTLLEMSVGGLSNNCNNDVKQENISDIFDLEFVCTLFYATSRYLFIGDLLLLQWASSRV